MAKIIKGRDPVGTEHYCTMLSANKGTTAYYRVIGVTGTETHAPAGEPVVWLRLNRKAQQPVDNFVSLPLSLFAASFEPVSKADEFYGQ